MGTELEKMQENLSMVLQLLKTSVADRKEQTDMFTKLLQDSEQRMTMVGELAFAVKSLSEFSSELKSIYENHINHVIECRDKMMEENKILISINNELKNDLRAERERYDSLMKYIFKFAGDMSNHTQTSINVK